jgi:hypothetical protein
MGHGGVDGGDRQRPAVRGDQITVGVEAPDLDEASVMPPRR